MSHSVGHFGDKFRKARESKDLSFDDISNVTKISSRMLKAIEDERFDLLPGGVFNKGFIRAYAKHLGLNDEEAISDYLLCLRQAQVDSHEVWDPTQPLPPQKKPVASTTPPKPAPEPIKRPLPYNKPAVTPLPPIKVEPEEVEEAALPLAPPARQPSAPSPELSFLSLSSPDLPSPKSSSPQPPSKLPWNLILAAVVVVALSAFLVIHRYTTATHRSLAAPRPTASAQLPATSAASQPAPALPPTPVPSAPANSSPEKSSQVPAPKPSATAAAATPATAPAPAPSKPGKDPTTIVRGDVTIRNFPNAVATSNPPAPASLSLILRAKENCRISVTSDGQLIAQETLIAPAATSFHATRQLVVHLGNAAAVTFLFNGKELPSQGSEGKPQTFTFDAQGMHPTP